MDDLDRADSILVVGCDPLHAMPILDLRLRKVMRRSGTRVVVASERPTALDGGAEETLRYPPGGAAAFLDELAAELASGQGREPLGPERSEDLQRVASELRPGSTVIVYGERVGHGPDGERALSRLAACAQALRLADDGSGLLEVPESANARGLREVGCLPAAGPGLSEVAAGKSADEIKQGLIDGEIDALVLWDSDPLRQLPDPEGWKEALAAADFVCEVGLFGNASGGHADVFLPAETHAEKEGTVTHPDGRLQRLRPSVPHPDETRHGWQWLAELASRLGHETGIDSAPEALEAIAADVPFYAGLTHEEIGGKGVRWQERDAVSAFPTSGLAEHPPTHPASGASNGGLRLGTYRDLWAAEVTERSPALRFLLPGQTLELALADAEKLGVAQGDDVEVHSNGHSVRAKVAVRERMRPGAGFLIEGLAEQGANMLAGAETVEIAKAAE
jgi:NADH-quinone oxidoreductase subunit G